jgi:hypothetical protein
MVELTAGDERFRNDHGDADQAVAAALAAYASGTGTEHAALTALADARLLVPVVAVLAGDLAEGAGPDAPGRERAGRAARGGRVPGPMAGFDGEKPTEMAMPAIVGRDGRPALPAFTSLDALRRWQSDARPLPVPASGVWQSAVQESCAVIIDIAGPVPLAVEGARLSALADGARVPGLHEDPDVWQLVAAAAAEIAPGIRVRLSPPLPATDMTLELAPPEGAAGQVPEDVAVRIADAVTTRLAGRAPAGIAVLRRPGG